MDEETLVAFATFLFLSFDNGGKKTKEKIC